jgi:hypothetical protein
LAVSYPASAAVILESELPQQFSRYGFLLRGGDLTDGIMGLPKFAFCQSPL